MQTSQGQHKSTQAREVVSAIAARLTSSQLEISNASIESAGLPALLYLDVSGQLGGRPPRINLRIWKLQAGIHLRLRHEMWACCMLIGLGLLYCAAQTLCVGLLEFQQCQRALSRHHDLRYDHVLCSQCLQSLNRLGAAAAKAAAQQPWYALEALPTMTSEAKMAARTCHRCWNKPRTLHTNAEKQTPVSKGLTQSHP